MFSLLQILILLLHWGDFSVSSSTEPTSDYNVHFGKHSRSYKGLTLSNGLQVILVNDPFTSTHAASLCISAGSLSNPPEIQGLAHFLEHLVLLGNHKYPEPDAFKKFITANGGQRNGGTVADYTEFTFNVYGNRTILEDALTHMFNTLTAPLLLESSIREEIHAIDSEHNKNIPQHERRFNRIESATARIGHPFQRFELGNEESLINIPTRLGIDLHKELIKFHDKYYSSNLMSLAVISTESMSSLEEMVRQIFGEVKDKNTTKPNWPVSPYGASELGVKVTMESTGGLKYMSVNFPILEEFVYIFERYYVKIFNHGGNHSLFHFLKLNNYATFCAAGVNEKYRGFNLFTVRLALTEYGIDHHDEIIVHVFEFIQLLNVNGPQEWFWDEVQEIRNITNTFQTRVDNRDLVSSLGKMMTKKTPEAAIQKVVFDKGDDLENVFNWTQIAAAIDALSPTNMRVTLQCPKCKVDLQYLEPFYQIKYRTEMLSPNFLKLLEQTSLGLNPNPFIRMPATNFFIPKNFELVPIPNDAVDYPTPTEVSDFSILWLMQDSYYMIPKTIICLKLYSPYSYVTPGDVGLNFILMQSITDRLIPITDVISSFGAQVSIENVMYGIDVVVTGYSDGIDRILYRVMDTISSMTFTTATFNHAKGYYKDSVTEALRAEPCDLADQAILLDDEFWTFSDQFDAINDLSLEGLNVFYAKFMSRLNFVWFVYGNILLQDALEMVNTTEHLFNKVARAGKFEEVKLQARNIQLQDGSNWLYKMNSPVHTGTCAKVVFQAPTQEMRDLVKILVLVDFIEDPLYNELRSKEQLGYVAGVSSPREMGDASYAIEMHVQGGYAPVFVEERVNKFLLRFQILRNVTTEEFKGKIERLSDSLDFKYNQIEENGRRIWQEISFGHYKFFRNLEKMRILSNLSISEVQEFYEQLVGLNLGTQRRISIHVTHTNSTMEKTMITDINPIGATVTTEEDITLNFLDKKPVEINRLLSWKRQQHLFPTLGVL